MKQPADRTERKRVAIGLGANLGDPRRQILEAVRRLRGGGLKQVRLSALYRTQPEECVPGTPDFLNAVVTGAWAGSPLELLGLCHAIEVALGRPPTHSQREARTVDLDLLLVGEETWDTPTLRLPHPRLRSRLFVLVPLADVAPDWRLPPDGIRAAQACAELRARTPDPDAIRPAAAEE